MTLASVTVIGGAVASSLMIGPSTRPAAARPSALPLTGSVLAATSSSTPVLRIRHGIELGTPEAPTELYEQFVPPPPPPPPPPPAPAAFAPARWTPPAGYVTIPVPIYRQAMTLDCETSALRMGLATFG